jgi:hypothetical protein
MTEARHVEVRVIKLDVDEMPAPSLLVMLTAEALMRLGPDGDRAQAFSECCRIG